MAPVRGELRYWLELARLLVDRRFLSVEPAVDPPPVLLIPGFMAGDASLTALGGWLRSDCRDGDCCEEVACRQ